MPSNCLCIRFENDDHGSGKLMVRAEAGGFAGHGGAYFSISQIEEFAAAIGAFPLATAKRPSISGGFWKQAAPSELEQEHLGIEVYPIDAKGHIGFQLESCRNCGPPRGPSHKMPFGLRL